MRAALFTMALITITSGTKGQNLIINSTTYKAGIYRTFEEFKHNNPSIDFNYEVKTNIMEYGLINPLRVTYYRIAIDRKVGKSLGKVFGFCDGKNVYINEFSPRLGPKVNFSKIEYFGKYCYYEGMICASGVNGLGYHCGLDEKIIDIDSGEITHLSKRTLREIITDDTALLNEFNDESRKNKKLKEYIIQYLERRKL